jgi:hypothetical protein
MGAVVTHVTAIYLVYLDILWILVLPVIFSIDWSVAETKNEG